ncbi:MAG TPA: metalloprotease PmbA [Alcanivoracaceae bacterium]|nr:metalloprotease PmbA [Alcanivoracaceae bacterium]
MTNKKHTVAANGTMAAPSQAELGQLKQQVESILAEAQRQGATAAEVNIGQGIGLSAGVRLGEVETLEFHRDRGVSLTVYLDQCSGSASSTDTSPESIRETVAAALAIAKHTGADEASGLAHPEQLADANALPDLDLCHEWAITPEQAIAIALQCEEAGRQDARIVNSEGAQVSVNMSTRAYGNSEGFVAAYNSSRHGLSCVLVAEQDGQMQRDYYYDSHRVPSELMAPEAIGAEAARRTLARLGAQRPATGQWPVLFAADVAKGVLGHLVRAISGAALYRKASFLLDRLGTTVMPEWVTLGEQPHIKQGAASAPFDSDGLPTRAQNFVEDGVLTQYALSLYSARRLGMQPTGNGGGVRNLVMPAGDASLAELCQRMGTGVLVTEVMGQGVNIVTGDYSRGAAGFWVENGVISHPIEEFTIAGNLTDMLLGIQAVGHDVDKRGGIQTGSILMSPMTIAGQ